MAENVKHDFGPLTVGGDDGVLIYGPDGMIGEVGFGLRRDAEMQALAKLFAAAPDLRAALKRFRAYGCPECGGDCSASNPPVACCLMQQADAALAKAEQGGE